MIKGNRIEFGYGDVLCGVNNIGVDYTNVKPPLEIGTCIKDTGLELEHFEIGKQVVIPLHGLEDLNELCRLIKSVTEDNPVVEFGGYVFDFSNYNRKSVEVVLKTLNKPHPMWMMTLAC